VSRVRVLSPSTIAPERRRWLLWLLLAQLPLVALMVLDWRIPVALVVGAALVLGAVRKPLWAVGAVIAGRLISTGSMSFIRIGKINIGLFEPLLAVALVALAWHAITRQQRLLHRFPWRAPLLVFAAWQCVGLLWCESLGQGIQELIAVGVILATTTIILTYVQTTDDVRTVLAAWLVSSVVIGLLAAGTDFTGVGDMKDTWEIASKGGRETGLGQQPNWFAMNLMFIVLPAFALAAMERSDQHSWRRWAFVLAGFFVFFSQLRSGSRGGIYSLVIGASVVGLAHPIARKWLLRFGGGALAVFVFYSLFGGGTSTSKAVRRIVMNLGNTWGEDVRQQNWLVCMQMFGETWGRGVGPGGYAELLQHYNWRIYDSIHRYPHGIAWGLAAHYGVIGLACAGWLLARVVGMGRDLVKWTKGTPLEILAWTMPATMLGYILWSFVEFNFDDKPFWEFLAVFTAFWLAKSRTSNDVV
jgi:hypothetical protein